MADVKWIKIITDIFDDEKILLIEGLPDKDSIIVIWFKLLCLAGKQNNNGVFIMNDKIAYTDEMLSTIFRRPINTVRLAITTFEQYGMIEVIDGVITIPNWGKHQTLDKIEKKNEYQKEYMREYREKQKQIACKTNSNTNSKTNVSLLEEELELDKELDKDIKDNRAKSTRFVPPTLEEVQDYCLERNNKVDVERFIDFYTSKGWMVGKSKMKDWKACVRTWERSNSTSTQQTQKPVKKSAMEMVLESLKGE